MSGWNVTVVEPDYPDDRTVSTRDYGSRDEALGAFRNADLETDDAPRIAYLVYRGVAVDLRLSSMLEAHVAMKTAGLL